MIRKRKMDSTIDTTDGISMLPVLSPDLIEEDLIEKFASGVSMVTSLALAIDYPTISDASHMLINGYKNALAIAVQTDYSFTLANKVKEYLSVRNTTDQMSTLPQCIVHHIMSYLRDDQKALVRMSVLSKSLFAETASFPIFNFVQDEKGSHVIPRGRFFPYMSYTITRFCVQNINAHTLNIRIRTYIIDKKSTTRKKKTSAETDIETLDRCLGLILEKGVQVLAIDIYNLYDTTNTKKYRLPQTLLSCASSLTSLTIHRCELPSIVDVVKFDSLKLLSLVSVKIDQRVIEYLTRGCPLLEEVYLKDCYGFKTFCVYRRHNLKKVQIFTHSVVERIDIDAPNLCHLSLDIDSYTLVSWNLAISASSLTSLTLHKCELPLMVVLVKFDSLKLLSLNSVPVDEGVMEFFTTGCPLLEEVYLKYCDGLKTFCVYRHHNLKKIQMWCDSEVERIDIDAPNLCHFLLVNHFGEDASVNLASCKKLTSLTYCGYPQRGLTDFLSNFPLLESLWLYLYTCDSLKFSNHSLKRLQLNLNCDLEKLDISTPNLHFFEYSNWLNHFDDTYFVREDLSESKGCMKCYIGGESFDTLWFQKLRTFLDKNDIIKVSKLVIKGDFRGAKDLKVNQSPPFELEHVELEPDGNLYHHRLELLDYKAFVNAVLCCCKPRSLTIKEASTDYTCDIDMRDVFKYTYEKLQQEDDGQMNTRFVLSYS